MERLQRCSEDWKKALPRLHCRSFQKIFGLAKIGPTTSYSCRVVVFLASIPAIFGPSPKVVVEERAAGPGICFSAPVSSKFYVLPCAALWRALSWSWKAAATTLLDEIYAFVLATRWRAQAGGHLLLLPPSLAPPGGVHGAGAGQLLQLPGWGVCFLLLSPKLVLCCVALHPPLSTGQACPAGAALEEHLLLQRIPTAAAALLDCCWTYVRAGLYL